MQSQTAILMSRSPPSFFQLWKDIIIFGQLSKSHDFKHNLLAPCLTSWNFWNIMRSLCLKSLHQITFPHMRVTKFQRSTFWWCIRSCWIYSASCLQNVFRMSWKGVWNWFWTLILMTTSSRIGGNRVFLADQSWSQKNQFSDPLKDSGMWFMFWVHNK